MIEVVHGDDAPCLSSRTESAAGFCLSFVLDNASGVNICGCRDAFFSMTEDNDTVMKWVEKSTTLKPMY